MKTIYISGPMTGLPDNNYPEFNRIAALLDGVGGFNVINPADNEPPVPNPTQADYMAISRLQVVMADIVVCLPGWMNSVGAREEIAIAKTLGIPFISVDWLIGGLAD